MKKISILILILLTVSIGSLDLHAGFSYEVGFVSSFVWRGMDLYPKNKPALQPSITYTFGDSGISISMFASYTLTDRNELRELEEIDFTFNYDFQISENISFSVGMTNYGWYYIPDYTFKDGNTQEFYAILGFPRFFLGPSFSVYYDINLGDGLYALFSLGHTFKLSGKTHMEISASLGYNRKQWIDESGISDLNLSAAIPFSVGKLSITPSIHYTHVFLESLYREGNKKEKLWFAVLIGIN
jgi:uncharacterized protein (TIGR02001 family)